MKFLAATRLTITLLSTAFRDSLAISRRFLLTVWRTVPSYLPFYLLAIVVGYAAWQAYTPVTLLIMPFQLAIEDHLHFSGVIVADTLQDSLMSIHHEIEGHREDASLGLTLMGRYSTGLRPTDVLQYPAAADWRIQAPPRFAGEVKGLSYE